VHARAANASGTISNQRAREVHDYNFDNAPYRASGRFSYGMLRLIGFSRYRQPNSLYLIYFSPTPLLSSRCGIRAGLFVASGAVLAFLLHR
jgi:hypothetical protein